MAQPTNANVQKNAAKSRLYAKGKIDGLMERMLRPRISNVTHYPVLMEQLGSKSVDALIAKKRLKGVARVADFVASKLGDKGSGFTPMSDAEKREILDHCKWSRRRQLVKALDVTRADQLNKKQLNAKKRAGDLKKVANTPVPDARQSSGRKKSAASSAPGNNEKDKTVGKSTRHAPSASSTRSNKKPVVAAPSKAIAITAPEVEEPSDIETVISTNELNSQAIINLRNTLSVLSVNELANSKKQKSVNELFSVNSVQATAAKSQQTNSAKSIRADQGNLLPPMPSLSRRIGIQDRDVKREEFMEVMERKHQNEMSQRVKQNRLMIMLNSRNKGMFEQIMEKLENRANASKAKLLLKQLSSKRLEDPTKNPAVGSPLSGKRRSSISAGNLLTGTLKPEVPHKNDDDLEESVESSEDDSMTNNSSEVETEESPSTRRKSLSLNELALSHRKSISELAPIPAKGNLKNSRSGEADEVRTSNKSVFIQESEAKPKSRSPPSRLREYSVDSTGSGDELDGVKDDSSLLDDDDDDDENEESEGENDDDDDGDEDNDSESGDASKDKLNSKEEMENELEDKELISQVDSILTRSPKSFNANLAPLTMETLILSQNARVVQPKRYKQERWKAT